jgi:hypothetical protein
MGKPDSCHCHVVPTGGRHTVAAPLGAEEALDPSAPSCAQRMR